MNTFTSCGFHWYPWPADGKCPCAPDQHVRVLTSDEHDEKQPYDSNYIRCAYFIPWNLISAGWYPVNPDGTEITPFPIPSNPTYP